MTVVRDLHVVAHLPQQERQALRGVDVVVDQQDAAARAGPIGWLWHGYVAVAGMQRNARAVHALGEAPGYCELESALEHLVRQRRAVVDHREHRIGLIGADAEGEVRASGGHLGVTRGTPRGAGSKRAPEKLTPPRLKPPLPRPKPPAAPPRPPNPPQPPP